MKFPSIFGLALAVATLVVAEEDIADNIPADCTLNPMITMSKDIILGMHNEAREREGGMSKGIKPLLWSQKLACSSQKWANMCKFEHSTSGYAENIGAGTIEETMNGWYMEYKDYVYGATATDQTGHFFNMAWKDGKWVGCGAAVCTSRQMGLAPLDDVGQLIICEYLNDGHFESDSSKEVWRPTIEGPLTYTTHTDHLNVTGIHSQPVPPPKSKQDPLPPPSVKSNQDPTPPPVKSYQEPSPPTKSEEKPKPQPGKKPKPSRLGDEYCNDQ